MLRGGPLVELADEVGQPRLRARGHEVVGEGGEGGRATPSAPGPHRRRSAASRVQPAPTRTSRTSSGSGVEPSSPRAAPRSSSTRLAHLLAREEPLAAAHEVGHARVGERRLERLGLGVGAEQDRDLGRRDALPAPARRSRAATAAASAGSSGCWRQRRVRGRRSATARPGRGAATRASRAPRPARSSDEVGQTDDLRRRAVVADQADHRGLRVPAREPEQVAGAGAGERVDGLGRVADDAQVLALAQPQVEQPLLERVDVLVLVDDEVAVLRRAPSGRSSSRSARMPTVSSSTSSKSMTPRWVLTLLVGLEEPRHRRAGRGRRVAAARRGRAAAYVSGVSRVTFAHSISAARSRIGGPVELQPQPGGRLGDGRRPCGA